MAGKDNTANSFKEAENSQLAHNSAVTGTNKEDTYNDNVVSSNVAAHYHGVLEKAVSMEDRSS